MSFYVVIKGKSINEECAILSVDLPKTYRLRGEWEVGITSSSIEIKDSSFVWIFCDLVEFSALNNVPMQLIDNVGSGTKKNTKPMYVRVIRKSFSHINVDMRLDPNKEEKIASEKDFVIVLHFRKA